MFGQHKFGGNAQAITGKRWLHHTSLLWRYQPSRMAQLAHPKKAPTYRQVRARGGVCSAAPDKHTSARDTGLGRAGAHGTYACASALLLDVCLRQGRAHGTFLIPLGEVYEACHGRFDDDDAQQGHGGGREGGGWGPRDERNADLRGRFLERLAQAPAQQLPHFTVQVCVCVGGGGLLGAQDDLAPLRCVRRR